MIRQEKDGYAHKGVSAFSVWKDKSNKKRQLKKQTCIGRFGLRKGGSCYEKIDDSFSSIDIWARAY